MGHLLVAAIDFGTTYSGWAFSFKHEYERDPVKISAKNWIGGQLVSQKGPTCVLIKSDGKTLDSFGYEAENKYAELALEKSHKEWYFFKRFKMVLFNRIGIERNIRIEDATGKKLPAKTVFKLSIQYLKDDLIETSGKRLADGNMKISEIQWVLTVPAIWNDAAKQFMREAAESAGISADKLTICLEPEAASLLCRHLPVEKTLGREKSLASFKAGTVYIVLDAGGGTIDITVHQIKRSGEIRELHKASGGDWGGTKVDNAFEHFLGELVGKEVVSKFKDSHMEDYIELFRNFEIKKRETSLNNNAKVTLRLPLSFFETVTKISSRTLQECIIKTKYREMLTVMGDKVRMDVDVMRSFFDDSVRNTLQHVEMLLGQPKVHDCSAIVMVGGFSESPILQEAVREKFSNLKIIVPDEAGLAVLKGAVIFGHNPKTIAERVCKFTYGVGTNHITSPLCKHPPCEQKAGKDGIIRCKDLFIRHVKINQTVKIGEETKPEAYFPAYDNQTNVRFDIFASSDPKPFVVTGPDCSKIGSLSIKIPESAEKDRKERRIEVSFIFGGTEIAVKAVDTSTGKTANCTVDFLG